MRNSKYLAALIALSALACAKNNTNKIDLQVGYSLGRSSSEGVPLEPKLFNNLGYQSDRVRFLIGENLQYHFQEDALETYLTDSMNAALNISNAKELPDVFSMVIRPKSLDIPPADNTGFTNAITQLNQDYAHDRKVLTELKITKDFVFIAADIPVVGKFANKISDLAIDAQVKYQKEIYAQMTADYLKKVVIAEDSSKLHNLDDPKNAADIQIKYSNIEYINKYACESNCTTETQLQIQQVLNNNMIKLAKANSRDLHDLSRKVLEQSKSTSQIQKDFQNMKTDLGKLNTEMQSRFESLSQTQEELNQKVTAMSEQINDTRKDVAVLKDDVRFMKDFMYSKMSNSEKLMALKNGTYGSNMLIEKKELLEKQLEFQTKMESATQVLSGINTILGNLGINNPTLNKVVQYSSVLNSLAGSLLSPSPDYFSAAMTLTGLFGKSSDVQAERYKEIINKLNIINGKLDKVLELQGKIYDLQVTTIQMLDNVSKKLDIAQDKIDSALLGIKINRLGISELLNRPLDSCNQFIDGLNNIHKQVGYDVYSNTHVTPYQARLDHFSSFQNQFSNCDEITTQLSLISTQNKISQIFTVGYDSKLDTTNGQEIDSDKLNYLKIIYPNQFNYFSSKIYAIKSKDERINTLRKYFVLGLGEYKDPKELLSKYNFLFNSSEGQVTVNNFFNDSKSSILKNMDEVQLLRALENPLSKESVLQVTEVINKIFFYFDIVQNGNMLNLKELLNSTGRGTNSKGYLALKNIYTTLLISQVQSNIENGILSIPTLSAGLEKSNNDDIQNFLLLGAKDSNFQQKVLTYFLVNKASSTSKQNLFKQYETVDSMKITPAALFDSRLDGVINGDERDTQIESLNKTFGLNKDQNIFIDFRKTNSKDENETANLVFRYTQDNKTLSEKNIRLFHFKVSAENLWPRDPSFEVILKAYLQTHSNLYSYETQKRLFDLNQDKTNLFNYIKLIYKTAN